MNNNAEIKEDKAYQYYLYKANKTLWYFNDLIKNNFSGYNAVKFRNKQNVYVWLENVTIEGDFYTGRLAKNGTTHNVLIENCIDWMIVDNRRLIGGYTIRHYRDTLDNEERLNFDIDFGVKIDDGNDHFKPDFSTPEGAIIKIEDYYSEKNLDGVLSCKDFLKEAENILSDRDITIPEELKSEIAEILELAFYRDLKESGFPCFKNIERSFNIKKEKKDLLLIEEKVIYKDGKFTINNLWVGFNNNEWKVLNLAE